MKFNSPSKILFVALFLFMGASVAGAQDKQTVSFGAVSPMAETRDCAANRSGLDQTRMGEYQTAAENLAINPSTADKALVQKANTYKEFQRLLESPECNRVQQAREDKAITERVDFCKKKDETVQNSYRLCDKNCLKNLRACFDVGNQSSAGVLENVLGAMAGMRGATVPGMGNQAMNCDLPLKDFFTEEKSAKENVSKVQEKVFGLMNEVSKLEKDHADAVRQLQEADQTLVDQNQMALRDANKALRDASLKLSGQTANYNEALRAKTNEKELARQRIQQIMNESEILLAQNSENSVKINCSKQRQEDMKGLTTRGYGGAGQAAAAGITRTRINKKYDECIELGQKLRENALRASQQKLQEQDRIIINIDATLAQLEQAHQAALMNLNAEMAELNVSKEQMQNSFFRRQAMIGEKIQDLGRDKANVKSAKTMEQLQKSQDLMFAQNQFNRLGTKPNTRDSKKSLKEVYVEYTKGQDALEAMFVTGCCPDRMPAAAGGQMIQTPNSKLEFTGPALQTFRMTMGSYSSCSIKPDEAESQYKEYMRTQRSGK